METKIKDWKKISSVHVYFCRKMFPCWCNVRLFGPYYNTTDNEDIIYLWDKLYACDPKMKGIVVDTVIGPSTPNKDYYDDINAII